MQSEIMRLPSSAPLVPGDLVKEAEAAAILEVSVQTLRNWRWARKGPRARKRSDLALSNVSRDFQPHVRMMRHAAVKSPLL